MALDPGIASLLSFLEQSGYPPMHEGSVEDARKGYAAMAAASIGPDGPVPVGSVIDTSVAGLPARVYRPEVEGPVPTVLFFHGGGFVIGSLDTHDNVCRRLCVDTASVRSEEHTSELQSLMRISYAVFCLKKKKTKTRETN